MSAKQRGLGRGLGALIGDFPEEPESGAVTKLPLQKVEPNPDQPRRTFDEEELQALADSIAAHGILQPLAVRASGDGFYQIIAGERRWRAARMAGLSEVPVVVLEADDRTVMELALVENLQRQDLNPMEEAEGYQRLMKEYGLTQEEAAARVGKSRPAVANALRLLLLLFVVEQRRDLINHVRQHTNGAVYTVGGIGKLQHAHAAVFYHQESHGLDGNTRTAAAAEQVLRRLAGKIRAAGSEPERHL
jgi:ParB/RepB/Spo0J family partition protein